MVSLLGRGRPNIPVVVEARMVVLELLAVEVVRAVQMVLGLQEVAKVVTAQVVAVVTGLAQTVLQAAQQAAVMVATTTQVLAAVAEIREADQPQVPTAEVVEVAE